MPIIRYTTPTIRFTFSQIDITDIAVAYLVIKQAGNVIIERDLSSATVINTQTEQALAWTLTQQETLLLNKNINAAIYCDWKLASGTRGRSHVKSEAVEETGKSEVI